MEGKLTGEVFTGVGDGEYYISMDYYSDIIEEYTGFKPFPGTLNIYVDPERRKKLLEETDSRRVSPKGDYIGFSMHEVIVEGIEAVALDLEKTDHGDDVLELVAEKKLRDVLDLKDGEKVKLKW